MCLFYKKVYIDRIINFIKNFLMMKYYLCSKIIRVLTLKKKIRSTDVFNFQWYYFYFKFVLITKLFLLSIIRVHAKILNTNNFLMEGRVSGTGYSSGAIFRNHTGASLGCFSAYIGFQSLLYVELFAVILAIQYALERN